MKTFIENSFFVLLLTQICFGQWMAYQSLTDVNQNDVCYSGSNQIFIVCDNGIMLQTRNSGANWNQIQLAHNSNLNTLFFVDANIGYIAGDNGRIFRREDCWENWADISINFYFHLKDLAFLDHDNGIVVGSKEVHIDGHNYFLPTIHVTTNAGLSWSEKQFDMRGKLNSVCYLGNGIVFAVGDSGLVFRSTDYGSTWNSESMNLLTNLYQVRICPNNVAIITGYEGTFLYSMDFGENWQTIEVPCYYHIKGACFNNTGEIVAACTKEVKIDGKKYYMATIIDLDPLSNQWTEEFSIVRGKYNSVSFCQPNTATAVGDSGLIASYQSPISVISDEGNLVSFKLEQNYPNPFNPSTRISWQSPVGSWQILKVYDVLGNEIVILISEEKETGYYSVDFKGSDLPSGVYFYRLKAGNFNETKKMILLR